MSLTKATLSGNERTNNEAIAFDTKLNNNRLEYTVGVRVAS